MRVRIAPGALDRLAWRGGRIGRVTGFSPRNSAGSSPVRASKVHVPLAQPVEQPTLHRRVRGSSPRRRTCRVEEPGRPHRSHKPGDRGFESHPCLHVSPHHDGTGRVRRGRRPVPSPSGRADVGESGLAVTQLHCLRGFESLRPHVCLRSSVDRAPGSEPEGRWFESSRGYARSHARVWSGNRLQSGLRRFESGWGLPSRVPSTVEFHSAAQAEPAARPPLITAECPDRHRGLRLCDAGRHGGRHAVR